MQDIALEHIPMIPQEIRKSIMYQVVEAESRIWASDVDHGDAHPRNIVLKTNPGSTSPGGIGLHDLLTWISDPGLSVCYIDFDHARVGVFTDEISYRSPGQGDKPVSPIIRWSGKGGRVEVFEEWGWVDWDWQRWLEECWGDSTFYTPITLELERTWTMPDSPKAFADQRHRVVSVRDLLPKTQMNNMEKTQQSPGEALVDRKNLSSPATTAASDTASEEEDSRKRRLPKMRV